MRILIMGWFSFSDGHATAGDLLAADVVTTWLRSENIACETAYAQNFGGGIDWRTVDPSKYSAVVFVCGPFECGRLEAEFFAKFSSRRIIGVDLSFAEPIGDWNPFNTLLERDSPESGQPDLVFSAVAQRVPRIGVCLVEDYDGGNTAEANAAINELLDQVEGARVKICTRLDENTTGLRSKSEIEAMLSGMDVVVTTRLHGLVLALKNGVPVVPIDPAPNGAKIVRQAQTIGWPFCFVADSVSVSELRIAFEYCLSSDAKQKAKDCCDIASNQLLGLREDFIRAVSGHDTTPESLRENSRELLYGKLDTPTENSSSFSDNKSEIIQRLYTFFLR